MVKTLEEMSLYAQLQIMDLKNGFPPIKSKDLQILKMVWDSNEEHTMRMSDLVSALHVTPAAVTQMVNHYEDAGLLEKFKSDSDRRSNMVRIHPEILKLWENKRKVLLAHIEEYYASLEKTQQQALLQAIVQLRDYMKEHSIFNDS